MLCNAGAIIQRCTDGDVVAVATIAQWCCGGAVVRVVVCICYSFHWDGITVGSIGRIDRPDSTMKFFGAIRSQSPITLRWPVGCAVPSELVGLQREGVPVVPGTFCYQVIARYPRGWPGVADKGGGGGPVISKTREE